MESANKNPFDHCLKHIQVSGQTLHYYDINELHDPRLDKLPFTIRILLECAMRNCDNFNVLPSDIERILSWKTTSTQSLEIPFKPARVLCQDFTGVPLVVDLAAMRDAISGLGGSPQSINPQCPTDFVIDHSIQVDYAGTPDALELNEAREFQINQERFQFLKWGQQAFKNTLIVPPGSGIVHQVNLEYLAHVAFQKETMIYPDSVVGTDSHTTMINGLGVLGWGVGGIEAEAVMLGECISMVLPEVVGFKLTGSLPKATTATDLVLTVTEILRKRGVVGKFVEFFGPGIKNLSIADRATISNMAPEYGATCGFFPVDQETIEYLKFSGRTPEKCALVETYFKAQRMFKNYTEDEIDPEFSGSVIELDLSTVYACIAGPKRPQDRVPTKNLKSDWNSLLCANIGFKGFGLKENNIKAQAKLQFKGKDYNLTHGDIVIAAITSCTNTSNPDVLVAAGIVAKNAAAKGLFVKPYIKTSLSPGSKVVTKYLKNLDLISPLEQQGFYLAGYGCMTCIGNSGDIDEKVSEAITKEDIVAVSVLSGNRNFEGRVHPLTKANYLASPPLVVAFALAGTVNIDFETEPLGIGKDGPVFLHDIWPTREEVHELVKKGLTTDMFSSNYSTIREGNEKWKNLIVSPTQQYTWDAKSTYIHEPPFFKNIQKETKLLQNIENAYCLLNLGDSITTDHISPAGNIAKQSPAAEYLLSHGVNPKDFNSYGARRGNDEIMSRGTFANTRLKNKLLQGKEGPFTVHIPSGEVLPIFNTAQKYMTDNHQTVIIAGKEYGSGSSRDWAAKGPYLLGVKAVIAQSYERIHRSNLIGMGILPLEFIDNQNADSLGINGKEQFSIDIKHGDVKIGDKIKVVTNDGKEFMVKVRLDTEPERAYYKNGGILLYVLRKLASKSN